MLFCRSFLFIVVRCTLSTFFAGYFLSFMLNSPFLPSFNILLYNRKLLPNSNVSLFNIHNFLPLDFKIEGQILRCQQQHSCSKCEKQSIFVLRNGTRDGTLKNRPSQDQCRCGGTPPQNQNQGYYYEELIGGQRGFNNL